MGEITEVGRLLAGFLAWLQFDQVAGQEQRQAHTHYRARLIRKGG